MTEGFSFRERMAGWVSTRAVSDPVQGANQAEADRQWAEVVLTIDFPSLDVVVGAPDVPGSVRGSALIAGLSPVVMEITSGELRLFVRDPQRVQTLEMKYDLQLLSQEGRVFTLHGVKELERDSMLDVWRRTTTLFTTVTDDTGRTVAAGILHLTASDFARELATMRVTNATNPLQQLIGLPRFFAMFTSRLVRQFGGLLAEASAFPPPPLAPPRGRPSESTSTTFWCVGPPTNPTWQDHDDERAWLRLRRYHGGSKGPVLLAPGFGMSTDAFVTDTIDENLTEYLMANGYDVWLFDYRASPHLRSSYGTFTIDDVAREDWPIAVAEVCRVTKSPDVQVFAHCVGSMSFQMAMLWAGNDTMRGAGPVRGLLAGDRPPGQHLVQHLEGEHRARTGAPGDGPRDEARRPTVVRAHRLRPRPAHRTDPARRRLRERGLPVDHRVLRPDPPARGS